MKFLNIGLVVTLALSSIFNTTQARAGGFPWFDDERDCRLRWADASEGCRIRKEGMSQELATIDLRISQAESARDSSVKPKQDAAETFARLDEKHRDREEVFIPYLERTIRLSRELKDLLIVAAAPNVAKIKALIEMASIQASESPQPGLTPVVAAGLVPDADDTLSLSLLLDSTLEKSDPVSSSEQSTTVFNIRKLDIASILERLESTTAAVEKTHEAIAKTVGQLMAENELALETEKQNLLILEANIKEAQQTKTRLNTVYGTALNEAQQLRDRKNSLPDDINREHQCQDDGAHKRDSECATHYVPRWSYSEREHGSGGGGRF